MASTVQLTEVIYDRTLSDGEYPYDTTLLGYLTSDNTPVSTTGTNTGATADDVWIDFLTEAADWILAD